MRIRPGRFPLMAVALLTARERRRRCRPAAVPGGPPPSAAPRLTARRRCTTDRLYVGRGAYLDGPRVEADGTVLWDEARPAGAARIAAVGRTASAG
ncbi:hypothetical protein [Streptomyces cinereospinus]|uniref:hypothetical protein n=1 Tax=Streptomyces cinereospinus TaxID=285561 RepID=UPI0036125551